LTALAGYCCALGWYSMHQVFFIYLFIYFYFWRRSPGTVVLWDGTPCTSKKNKNKFFYLYKIIYCIYIFISTLLLIYFNRSWLALVFCELFFFLPFFIAPGWFVLVFYDAGHIRNTLGTRLRNTLGTRCA
jgi:hypothetical protein